MEVTSLEQYETAKRQAQKNVDEARKERKRVVRQALQLGQTVAYDLRTLLDDGHSIATIRKVHRA